MGFDYMGKHYNWKNQGSYQGIIDCTCESCQDYVKSLVKNGELLEYDVEVLKDVVEEEK